MGFVVARRLLQMLFVMVGISILVFLIFFATPGTDPAARIAGKNATPEILAAVRHDFGLDQPLYVQYLLLMKRLFVTGDLTSFVNRGYKVIPAIFEAVPATLSLVFGAAVIWVVVSVLVGVVAAATRNRWPDRLLMVLGLIGISMPVFWLGEMLNLITQDRYHDTWLFGWVPPLGYTPLTEDPWLWFKGSADSLVHPGGAVHRHLRARAARQPDRGLPGGLCPHRPRQGPVGDAGSCCATRCGPP